MYPRASNILHQTYLVPHTVEFLGQWLDKEQVRQS